MFVKRTNESREDAKQLTKNEAHWYSNERHPMHQAHIGEKESKEQIDHLHGARQASVIAQIHKIYELRPALQTPHQCIENSKNF